MVEYSESTQDQPQPAHASAASRVASNALFASAVVLTAHLLAIVLATRGRFRKIFLDFDVQLPVLTSVVCSAEFAWLVAAVFALTVIKQLLVRDSTAKAVFDAASIVTALALGGLYVEGIFLPLLELIDKLT
jgi:hypothetical protein